MKTILVTGGAGFLGSHLCELLILRGDRVICVDNLFTGSVDNIHHLFSSPDFLFLNHDIIDSLFLDDHPFLQGRSIDQVYNLACPASPVDYQFNAIRTIKAGTIGTINMLGLAKRHKARILQASTSEIYGDPEMHPQAESYRGSVNPIGPRACYDEGKRVSETLFFDYHRQNKVDIRVARIFNTYGPRMARDDGRVVSNFVVAALQGKDIPMYGDGSQTRSFCYVSDTVEGLWRLMNAEPAAGEELTGPVNIGNPTELTIKEIAAKVLALTRSASKIALHPLPVDDPRKRKPNIELAKSLLGWEPKVEVDEGLLKTIEYFKKGLMGKTSI